MALPLKPPCRLQHHSWRQQQRSPCQHNCDLDRRIV